MSTLKDKNLTFNYQLPKKCFRKFITTQLMHDARFKDLHEHLSKYPQSLDPSGKSFDTLAQFTHGVQYTDAEKSAKWFNHEYSKWERPVPSREAVEQLVLAYLEYRIYFSN